MLKEKMKIKDNKTPVVILGCKIGGVAIMRSLGNLGIPVYGVDDNPKSAALRSRYLKRRFIKAFDEKKPEEYLHFLMHIGSLFGEKSILIPTSDELSVFVAEHADDLRQYFLFSDNNPRLVKDLMSKKAMYNIAVKHDIPAPATFFPENLKDVTAFLDKISFPVMLKGIEGNRLQLRSGLKMLIVHSKEELVEHYQILEDPKSPNLMIQEYIPGGDDQVYIFNGYFNENSECLAAFTGHKIRQFPIHVGCASLGECRWNEEVATMTMNFMKEIGYRGILDIGYRLDPRDGKYKVLDINPRVGQAFRLFVAENGMDVVRCLYMDLTGQEIANPIIPKEGRRWAIEDFDIISSFHYHEEGTLGICDWMTSFKRLEEAAWFSWRDPAPAMVIAKGFLKKSFLWLIKKSHMFHS